MSRQRFVGISVMAIAHLVLWGASHFWVGLRTSEVYVDVVTYVLAIEGSFVGWLILVRDARLRPWRSWKQAVAVITVIAAPLFFSLPIHSVDVMYYQAHGRLWTVHGVSPYTHSILDYARDDAWIRTWTPTTMNPYTPYGPLHTLMEIAVSHLSGSSLWLSIFFYKALISAALLGALALLWHVFRLPSFLMVGVGLSPFVLMESVNNGHQDLVLILLLLIFLAAMRKKDLLRATLFLLLAVLWKIPAILFAPYLGWALIRGRRDLKLPMVIVAGIGFTVIPLIAAMPFLLTGGLWKGLVAQSDVFFSTFVSPIPSMLLALGSVDDGMLFDVLTKPRIRQIGIGLFLLSYALIGIQWMRSKISLPSAAAGMFGSYLLFSAFVFFPWYALWLIFFLPFLPSAFTAVQLLQVVSIAGLLAYPLHGIVNGLVAALLVLGFQAVWRWWHGRDMILP
ncbi:MAG: hypothetical protein AAB733_04765 [Patescibacteria group bacterium]